MFEDSTFESRGIIHTRSRRWMAATLAVNSAVLLALILIPLIYPQALPPLDISFLVAAPPMPHEIKPEPKPAAQAFQGQSEVHNGQIFAPPKIPTGIRIFSGPEEAPIGNIASIGGDSDGPGNTGVFSGTRNQPRVHGAPEQKVRVSGSVVAGLLLRRTIPVYPELAKAMRVEGTVVLAAVISKQGSIENLHVLSGHPALQQSALDAVRTWLYKPLLLNNEPVEVETTINVIFTLGR